MQKLAYQVARTFAFPIERLWDCWSDANELENWYSPVELNVVAGSVTSELRIGGLWKVAVDASAYGHIAYFFGSYLEIETNSKLVHTLHYTQSESEFQLANLTTESHLIEITFEQMPAGVLIKFSQFGEMDPGQAQMAQAGMESYFDNLEKYLFN